MGQEFVVPSFNTNRYYNKNTENIAVLPTGLTAGMIVFVGSDGTLDGSANLSWDNTNNKVTIAGGDAADATAPAFFVNRTAVASDDEAIARFGVSGLTDYLQIENTSTSAVHLPGLRGMNSTTNIALTLIGEGTTDTGVNPVMKFLARIGASTAVATRPLYGWYNGSATEIMALDPTGKLTFGGTSAYAVPSAARGALHYNASTGIMTLAAYSSSGNTQFALNTAVGAGTNATRFAISSTGAMALTPATTLTATTNGSTNLTETASSTHTLIVTRTSTSDANYGIKLTNLGTSGYGSAINWELYGSSATPNTYSAAQIKVENTGASGGGFLAFLTTPAASTTLAEVARLYNDTFLIGKTTGTLSNGILQVRALASASASETIARFDVSDDTSSYISFSNGTSSDSSFIPVISGVQSGTLQGLFLTAQVTTDTGTNPALALHARVGSGTIVATRPAFQFRNHTTTVGGFTGSTDGGRFMIGGNTLTPYGAASLLIETNKSAATSGVALNAWAGASAGIGNILYFNKSRSSTVGTHTVVASGDFIGGTYFAGSDGTAFINAAAIEGQIDGTPGTNDMPGRLAFYTTADGASTVTEAMRISSRRNVLVNLGAIAEPSTSVGTLVLTNTATAPTTSVDAVSLYAADISAGNASLAMTTETAVVTESITSDRTLRVTINGTSYRILLAV